jgi:poly(3-hydroxyalkanoate) depolymerase
VSGLDEQWFSFRGMRIRYVHRPSADQRIPLLIFNGLGQGIESLQPIMDAMQGSAIIGFDVPGAGKSDVPRLPLRYCQHARVARALLDQLNYPVVNVFGVSWGGGLAQQFTMQYSARVEKLILGAAVMGYMMLPANPLVYSKMSSPRRFTDADYMQSIAGDIYGGDLRSNPELVSSLLANQPTPSSRGYFYQAMAMYGWTSVPGLWRIRQQTLVLQGRDDPMVRPANARLLSWLLPNSRLEVLDCGHLFMLTRARKVADLITEFIA